MENLEIGTLIKWNIGTKTAKGIFKQITDDNIAEVITKSIEGTKVSVKTFVPLYLIEVDN